MELDELKLQWQEHDRLLQVNLRLNRRLLQQSFFDKAETALRRLSRWLWLELLINLFATFLLGSFLAKNIGEPRFAVPATLLLFGAIALVIAPIRQLATIIQIEHGMPIVDLQKRLESLRVERILAVKWVFLLAPLAWILVFIVAMKGLLHVDVFAKFGQAWLMANLVFGVLVILTGWWLCRHYAERAKASPILQTLMRDISGHNLAIATAYLRDLAEFEAERT